MENYNEILICENCGKEFSNQIDDTTTDECCSMLCLVQSLKKGMTNL